MNGGCEGGRLGVAGGGHRSGKADNDKIYRTIYDQMFGAKEDLMREAKKAGWVNDKQLK